MNRPLRTRLDYLIARLKARAGNRDVLIAEIVKAYNSRPARRASDARVKGWHYVEPIY